MPDTKNNIFRETVLAFIYAPQNRRRIIWSPGTTLSVMGIEQYPHDPPDNYRKMKKLLEQLFDEGHLVKRERLHSYFTHKEVAYQRVGENHSGVGG